MSVLESKPNISTTASPCQNGLVNASGMIETIAVKLVATSGRKRSAKGIVGQPQPQCNPKQAKRYGHKNEERLEQAAELNRKHQVNHQ